MLKNSETFELWCKACVEFGDAIYRICGQGDTGLYYTKKRYIDKNWREYFRDAAWHIWANGEWVDTIVVKDDESIRDTDAWHSYEAALNRFGEVANTNEECARYIVGHYDRPSHNKVWDKFGSYKIHDYWFWDKAEDILSRVTDSEINIAFDEMRRWDLHRSWT